ncbi:MAG: Trk family potassium uptake protein [Clostridia bacterium]|nr:Trk family potassium uptake protein [Clostridia bacterium]
MKQRKTKFRLSVWQILALAYLGGTIVGSILLILPFATKSGQSTSYLNALFTSASATCITGLAVYDTATHWTLFGQLVILFLVQMSGLGFMTLVSAAFLVFKRGMSVGSRNAFMVDSRGKFNGVGRLLKRIVVGTLLCETIGALLLMIRFIPDFGAGKGIYFSIWHSISAFCNAGFDLMGTAESQFVSLTAYAADPVVSLTITALVILGGLGFCVWGDVIDCKFNFKKFQLNTKVVLVVNCVLLISGMLLFLLFERNESQAGFNFGERLLVSLFNSTTPRSAGFVTTDGVTLSDSGVLLTVVLMFIGGGSGSTAGGIRVGTFAVLMMGMLSVFRGRRDINIGKKRIEYSLLSQALAIFAACLMILIVAMLIICAVEPSGTSLAAVEFECVSALSNAGLSLSLTPTLKAASRVILIILMYAGRVGILTLALALAEKRTTAEIRKPVDTLLIG